MNSLYVPVRIPISPSDIDHYLRAEMRRLAHFAADAAARPDTIKPDAALREVALRIERALGDKRL